MNKRWEEYTKYINSEQWKEKRQEVLRRDNRQCQTCNHDGTDYRLEVHHKTYDNFKNEPLDDLITLCRMCHEAITNVQRELRYLHDDIEPALIDNQEKRYIGNETDKVNCDIVFVNSSSQGETFRKLFSNKGDSQ